MSAERSLEGGAEREVPVGNCAGSWVVLGCYGSGMSWLDPLSFLFLLLVFYFCFSFLCFFF